MAKVLNLAFSQKGMVSPNPYVGCLLVIDKVVVGKGVHKGPGLAHAELDALSKLPKCYDRSKITLYVNLEPCCHFNKRTPPCAQLLIREGVKKVVIGHKDPNIYVSGNGIKLLRDNEIEVLEGVLRDDCIKLNSIFYKNMEKKTPYFHGKVACSLDGKIALNNGDSKWITSGKSRNKCHEERLLYDAILVGRNTFANDKPMLNTRKDNRVIKENKKIIVGDYRKIINQIPIDQREYYIILSKDISLDYVKRIKINDVFVYLFPRFLEEVFPYLLESNITSIYVEGGTRIFSYFLNNKLLDEISIFKAPKIIGSAKGFSDYLELKNLSESITLKNMVVESLGDDLLIKGCF